MLRVGLTGELGSGKSTVGRLLAGHGAIVLSSDEMGRAMMQPGEPVFNDIVAHFGPSVLAPDGTLDRPALAALAFDPRNPRVEELNALVHPAVLAEQERQLTALAETQPNAIVVIESALIFTTQHAGEEPWRKRFDQIILVTAPDDLKVRRFIERSAGNHILTESERKTLMAAGEARLAAQRIPHELTKGCIRIENTGSLAALETRTEEVFPQLQAFLDDAQVRATRS